MKKLMIAAVSVGFGVYCLYLGLFAAPIHQWIECENTRCTAYQETLLQPTEATEMVDMNEVTEIYVTSSLRAQQNRRHFVTADLGRGQPSVRLLWSWDPEDLDLVQQQLEEVSQHPVGQRRIEVEDPGFIMRFYWLLWALMGMGLILGNLFFPYFLDDD